MKPRLMVPFCVALLAGACGSGEEAPRPNPAAQQVNTATPVPPQDGEGALDHDGTLRPASQEVFKAPLPMASKSVAVGGGWAGYQNEHSYSEVTSFYRKKLGEDYNVTQSKGGTRLSSPDGKTDIYIPKPRKLGAPVRVFYFNSDPEASAPPVVGSPTRGSSSGASGTSATGSKAPPAANSPSGVTTTGSTTGSGGSTSGTTSARAAGGGGSAYRQEVTTDARGRRVIVYSPRADSDAGSGSGGAGGGTDEGSGSYRSYKVQLPPNFPD